MAPDALYNLSGMFGGSGNITLFRVRGIRVAVDWSWFIILFLVIYWLNGFYEDVLGPSASPNEPFLLAVASAVGFFGSILLHEFGHAWAALRRGIGISTIRLWIFGGMAQMDRESDSPRTEFEVAVAGPVVTAAIAVGLAAVGVWGLGSSTFSDALLFRAEAGTSGPLALVAWLASVNLLVLVFNLLPAYPMDGGRIVRSIAWKISGRRGSATRFAATLGRIFGWIFIALGVALFFNGVAFSGIWLALIGVLILGSAKAAYVQTSVTDQLEGITVADVMDESPVCIPAEVPASRALEDYFLRYQWSWFPVADGHGAFKGILLRESVEAVPEVAREATPVGDLVEPGSGQLHIPSGAPLDSLLGNPDMRRFGALMVTDPHGQLAGVITSEQLGRALGAAGR
jgi:Zn-dependent protease